ncbi:hypothetical protein Tco_1299385 [Tanacetum coccineum]
MNTPIDFSAYVMHNLKIDNLTQQLLVGPTFDLLKGTCKSRVELEYHFEECYKAVNDRLDCTNPEVKVAYDRYALWGISHWGLKQNKFYGFASHRVSKHDVYSRKRIILITHVKVMKWYDYGYLEEIEVRREDQTLHKFKEGDFPNLNLRDIEDMLLLLVQNKISNLERDVIFDLNVALRMPETFRSDISNKTPYTAYNNPQGVIYLDKLQRNRLIRSDELYKFCDRTLTSVRTALHDIASNLRKEYLTKRR